MMSSEMREMVFHLAQAIRSDQTGALKRLKEEHVCKIVECEDSIRRLCKKKHNLFLDANQSMDQFKGGLKLVRTNLG